MSSLPRIPRSAEDELGPEALAARHALAEQAAGRSLPHLGGAPLSPDSARGNIENMLGFCQVPVGMAGPMLCDTTAGPREVYVPMATTEGALVAAHSRGMRIANAGLGGGGVRSRVLHEGLTQNPMLEYQNAEQAIRAAEVVEGMGAELAEIAESITSHGRLVGVAPRVIGSRLIVELVFHTGDAIGINMAARAADLCSAAIEERTSARVRYVHGQDVEKRANARAQVEGRGRSVVCDVTVPRAALAELARVTPEQLVALQRAYSVGFAQLGTQNWLVQAANGLAAVMLACGQDVAYLTECATGFLDFQVTDAGDLYASATLPSLLVGTVGGGSQKGTAAECMALLGCDGDGHANTFAELLAAVVLCGDLSLCAAFCSHEFVAAHEQLGRNRPAPPAEQGR